MFPKSPKFMKRLTIIQAEATTSKMESTFNNLDEERDSPDAIINFINKKIHFKSNFDKKGSDEFLSAKDIALCDVVLDEEIEDYDENENYNNISFMENFTFNKENNLFCDEKNFCSKNQEHYLLNHSLFTLIKYNENNCNQDSIDKNEKNIGKNLKH